MKRSLPFLSLILILLVMACSGGNAILTAIPTVGQPTVPTAAPAATQPPASVQSQPGLTGTIWLWIGVTSPVEQVAVESPVNYSLVFQADSTVNITADCNNARGSYQVQGQSLTIQVGPMTKAACPPGSRSDEFIHYLGSAATYTFQDGNLFIDLAADGGTLEFATPETLKAEDGGGALSGALQANPWQWASFADPLGPYDVQDPGNYQLTFHENGTVDIRADCNTAAGTYALDGIKISISMGPSSLVACPPGSRSEEFLKYLGSAAIYFYQPGELFLDLMADGGTMRFTPVVAGN